MDIRRKIKLAEALGGLWVPARYDYKERAKILVEHAEYHQEFRKLTDKGIETLIGAGAFIHLLNIQHFFDENDEDYFHQVRYDGIDFTSSTAGPIIPKIILGGGLEVYGFLEND